MGQEKSLPDRCNSAQYYVPSTVSRSPSYSPSSASTTKTTYSTAEKQAKYLKQQLYIKSYIDIAEQDQNAQKHFKPTRPGLRNYTPKILNEKPQPQPVDIWI